MTRRQGEARFCGVAEAAKVLGVSRMTLYRMIEGGGFPAVRMRSRILIPLVVLERLENEAIQRSTVVDAEEVGCVEDSPVVMPQPRS
ncbi:helix-turn-helix domain-containing protein [Actinokineospora sp. NPDC004072]